MNLTDQFIDGLLNFSSRHFGEEDILHAKKCLLDYLAATIAGSREYSAVEKATFSSLLIEKGVTSIIGSGVKTTAPMSALINGISSHAVELDDGQRFGNIHPGAPIISALLAIGELYDMKISDLWPSILLGYESVLRLACSIQPGHKLKGFHATGPCGTVGASMALASLLGYNREQFKATLSAACTSAGGILEMIEGDTQMMPFNAGKAASNAIISALIGQAGYKVPEDALGGKRGFLHCFADDVNFDILTGFNRGDYFSTNYFKPYAACGHCHASIEAALKLRKKANLRADEIIKVEIETYKLALRGHDHNIINGVNSARMSIPYSAAVALLKGSADIDDFGQKAISDQELLNLTSRVHVSENESLTKQAPAKRMAIIKVYTSSGEFCESVDYPKGQPENPLSLSEICEKFSKCSTYAGLSNFSQEFVKDSVMNSDSCKVRDLMHQMSIVENSFI